MSSEPGFRWSDIDLPRLALENDFRQRIELELCCGAHGMVPRSFLRALLVVTGHLFLGVTIGLVVAMAYWMANLIGNGHSIPAALRGQVDDEPATLLALVALGGLCGAAVGLCSGLVVLARRHNPI